MDALANLLALPWSEREEKGLLHTPGEILQQPATWATTGRIMRERSEAVRGALERAGVAGDLGDRPTVFLVGAGTSDYVGRALAPLLRRAWGCEVWAVPSTDLLTCMDDLVVPGKRYLWVSFSRSGDSSEGVAALAAALDRYPYVHHVVVTCNGEGRMARDFEGENVLAIVLDDAVNDRGLAMTSSFSNMVVAGQCLAHAFDPDGYAPVLERLVGAGREFLPRAADAAERLVGEGFSKACFLGTGALAATATESSLKLLELTAGRLVTLDETFLGVRHGPLSAVDAETLVVAYVSGDPRRLRYEADMLAELDAKRLAKRVVVVGGAGSAGITGVDGESLAYALDETVGDAFRPPVAVIVGQLLGLFASLRHGLTPDAPSPTGAISRVVTQVRLY